MRGWSGKGRWCWYRRRHRGWGGSRRRQIAIRVGIPVDWVTKRDCIEASHNGGSCRRTWGRVQRGEHVKKQCIYYLQTLIQEKFDVEKANIKYWKNARCSMIWTFSFLNLAEFTLLWWRVGLSCCCCWGTRTRIRKGTGTKDEEDKDENWKEVR